MESNRIGSDLDRQARRDREYLEVPHYAERQQGHPPEQSYPTANPLEEDYCIAIANIGDVQSWLIGHKCELTASTFERLLGELSWLKGRLRAERDQRAPEWREQRKWRGKQYQ